MDGPLGRNRRGKSSRSRPASRRLGMERCEDRRLLSRGLGLGPHPSEPIAEASAPQVPAKWLQAPPFEIASNDHAAPPKNGHKHHQDKSHDHESSPSDEITNIPAMDEIASPDDAGIDNDEFVKDEGLDDENGGAGEADTSTDEEATSIDSHDSEDSDDDDYSGASDSGGDSVASDSEAAASTTLSASLSAASSRRSPRAGGFLFMSTASVREQELTAKGSTKKTKENESGSASLNSGGQRREVLSARGKSAAKQNSREGRRGSADDTRSYGKRPIAIQGEVSSEGGSPADSSNAGGEQARPQEQTNPTPDQLSPPPSSAAQPQSSNSNYARQATSGGEPRAVNPPPATISPANSTTSRDSLDAEGEAAEVAPTAVVSPYARATTRNVAPAVVAAAPSVPVSTVPTTSPQHVSPPSVVSAYNAGAGTPPASNPTPVADPPRASNPPAAASEGFSVTIHRGPQGASVVSSTPNAGAPPVVAMVSGNTSQSLSTSQPVAKPAPLPATPVRSPAPASGTLPAPPATTTASPAATMATSAATTPRFPKPAVSEAAESAPRSQQIHVAATETVVLRITIQTRSGQTTAHSVTPAPRHTAGGVMILNVSPEKKDAPEAHSSHAAPATETNAPSATIVEHAPAAHAPTAAPNVTAVAEAETGEVAPQSETLDSASQDEAAVSRSQPSGREDNEPSRLASSQTSASAATIAATNALMAAWQFEEETVAAFESMADLEALDQAMEQLLEELRQVREHFGEFLVGVPASPAAATIVCVAAAGLFERKRRPSKLAQSNRDNWIWQYSDLLGAVPGGEP